MAKIEKIKLPKLSKDNKKYKFTGDYKKFRNRTVYRIEYIDGYYADGGWIESEYNLCYSDSSRVNNNCIVCDRARVSNHTDICEDVIVSKSAKICNGSELYGDFEITGYFNLHTYYAIEYYSQQNSNKKLIISSNKDLILLFGFQHEIAVLPTVSAVMIGCQTYSFRTFTKGNLNTTKTLAREYRINMDDAIVFHSTIKGIIRGFKELDKASH